MGDGDDIITELIPRKCASTKNCAQCYQTDFSSDFSGWARDLETKLSVDKDCLPFVYARRSKPVEMLAEY